MTDLEYGSAKYQDLQAAVHKAEVDVNYALYHPLDEKYQSLYPRNNDDGAKIEDTFGNRSARKAGTTRPAIWKVVEDCMTGGTLEALRDGKLRSLLDERLQQNMSSKARLMEPSKKTGNQNGKVVSPVRKISPAEQDGDSDGGFFEE